MAHRLIDWTPHHVACACLALLAGCVEGKVDSALPPLVQLEGIVKNDTDESFEDLRLAVVWLSDHGLVAEGVEPRGIAVSQDIPVVLEGIEARFTLDLKFPPPDDVFLEYDELTAEQGDFWAKDGRSAVGVISAYEDLDGDGKMTFVQEGDTGFHDRIVGHSEYYLLWYQEGGLPELPNLVEGEMREGFNLMVTSPCFLDIFEGQQCSSELPETRIDDNSEPFSLVLKSDPQLNVFLCKPYTTLVDEIPDDSPCAEDTEFEDKLEAALPAEVLVSGRDKPGAITASGQRVVWVEEEALYQADAAARWSVSEVNIGGASAHRVTQGAGTLYWAPQSGPPIGYGGWGSNEALEEIGGGPAGVSVDSLLAYDGAIYQSTSIGIGVGRIGGAMEGVLADPDGVSGFALTKDRIYWATKKTGALKAAPWGDVEEIKLFDNNLTMPRVVGTSTDAVWLINAPSGPNDPAGLLSGIGKDGPESYTWSLAVPGLVGAAVDDDVVYWLIGDSPYLVALDIATGETSTPCKEPSDAEGFDFARITLGESHVYWTRRDAGAIYRCPKMN